MAFPTLSDTPLSIEVTPIDNSIRNETEAGYEIRRKRYSRQKHSFALKYQMLYEDDKDLLLNFYNNYGTVLSFNWTNHQTGQTHLVYLDEPLSYSRAIPGWWNFDTIKMIEV